MSIPSTTLSALQRAGQAVFDAHTELTAATRAQAAQVSESLEMNPFALENDTLYNTWKTMARLAQEVQNVEAQMRALYTTASAVNAEDGISVTDVTLLPTPEPTPPPAPVRGARLVSNKPTAASPLSGNNAKAMACLSKLLNRTGFTLVRQSRIAEAAGIPKGSINLAIRQLVALNAIEEGPKGHYRLV